MIYLTVAIPTYNGEKRLPDVLEKLRSQTGTEAIAWEVLVVDNNSSDNTPAVVQQFQQNWPEKIPLRYVFEHKQGLSFARQKAVTEARGELVGFLDDDNFPTPNWVAAAYQFAQEHPQAGAYGGKIIGKFESDLPKNFDRIACFLAIIEKGDQPLLYSIKQRMLPPGAGLIIRTSAWLENVPETLVLRGRTTKQMLASEDVEALRHIQKSGWEIWYNPAMIIYHCIPSHRTERPYLTKLCFGVGLSSYPIRMLKYPPWQYPFWIIVYGINDTRKILLHLWQHKNAIRTETVTASEMQFLLGRLLSSWYFIKNRLYLR